MIANVPDLCNIYKKVPRMVEQAGLFSDECAHSSVITILYFSPDDCVQVLALFSLSNVKGVVLFCDGYTWKFRYCEMEMARFSSFFFFEHFSKKKKNVRDPLF